MEMNRYSGKETAGLKRKATISTPLSTVEWPGLWSSEIQLFLDAEEDFLLRYGLQAGYDKDSISRILEYHRWMESLMDDKCENDIEGLAEIMAFYTRFKEGIFLSRIKD